MVIAEQQYRAGQLAGVVYVDMSHDAQATESRLARRWCRQGENSWHGITKVPFKSIYVLGLDLGDMDRKEGAEVVPSRNLILLAVASNVAVSLGADVMMIGATLNDERDYQDCRMESLQMTSLAFVAMGGLPIQAPLIHNTKTEVVEMAIELGLSREDAWSCYRSGPTPCGTCASCVESSAAWNANQRRKSNA